jgi:hypothetical protein
MKRRQQFHETITRRDVSVLALGIAAFATTAASATETKRFSQKEALEALDPWADALASGDPAKIANVLAPEYQIMRSNGNGYDRTSYLASLPKQRIRSKFSDIVATGGGDIMVLRYRIETDQTIEGKEVKGIAPRLSVFRRVEGRWLMSAHANFSALG